MNTQTLTPVTQVNNLIKAIKLEYNTRLENFISEINKTTSLQELDTWQYNDLTPSGKNINHYRKGNTITEQFESVKNYLIGRKEKQTNKSIEREVNRVNEVANAGTLIDVKINIEWKRSQMWGNNPKAECWYSYTDAEGKYKSGYVVSGSISGCGYDKQSTVVANCLNQINEVLKPLYINKNKATEVIPSSQSELNRELFGYGSGYGILPSIEGGVGVSCYNSIFDSIGYKFQTIASGKTFDSYLITKI